MLTKKTCLSNYNKYVQEFKEYQEDLRFWEQFKDIIGEKGFNAIKIAFHPISKYRSMKKLLEEKELPFCDWILRKQNIEKYQLSKEKQLFFLRRRKKLMDELDAIRRLLTQLSRKWNFKI
jgi:hypothetical protein